ncbi:hypothetical protein BT63DRAFT_457550 [Microthyrium microscopicum]|uniref:Uncharacterized protein n=1 Tax=Microthyrium microscopicum TaxID=703497 RepID=A0A6A6U4V3_9PEZI|nr:hypothetical protein BT63DRAFT_457550 [Microthyrium microscopicum]
MAPENHHQNNNTSTSFHPYHSLHFDYILTKTYIQSGNRLIPSLRNRPSNSRAHSYTDFKMPTLFLRDIRISLIASDLASSTKQEISVRSKEETKTQYKKKIDKTEVNRIDKILRGGVILSEKILPGSGNNAPSAGRPPGCQLIGKDRNVPFYMIRAGQNILHPDAYVASKKTAQFATTSNGVEHTPPPPTTRTRSRVPSPANGAYGGIANSSKTDKSNSSMSQLAKLDALLDGPTPYALAMKIDISRKTVQPLINPISKNSVERQGSVGHEDSDENKDDVESNDSRDGKHSVEHNDSVERNGNLQRKDGVDPNDSPKRNDSLKPKGPSRTLIVYCDLRFDVFYNGNVVHSNYISGALKWGKGKSQLFSGTKIQNALERPWILVPAGQNNRGELLENGSGRKVSARERWAQVSNSLLGHADSIRRPDDPKHPDHEAHRAHQAAHEVLLDGITSIAGLDMPSELDVEPKIQKLGIIDVLVTAGKGTNKGLDGRKTVWNPTLMGAVLPQANDNLTLPHTSESSNLSHLSYAIGSERPVPWQLARGFVAERMLFAVRYVVM